MYACFTTPLCVAQDLMLQDFGVVLGTSQNTSLSCFHLVKHLLLWAISISRWHSDLVVSWFHFGAALEAWQPLEMLEALPVHFLHGHLHVQRQPPFRMVAELRLQRPLALTEADMDHGA